MGMDAEHFVIKKTFDNTDMVNFDDDGIPRLQSGYSYDGNFAIVQLSSDKLVKWAENNGLNIHTAMVFDLDTWYDSKYKDTDFKVFDMDVRFESKDKFIYMQNAESCIYEYVYENLDDYYKEHKYIIAEVERRGYMRKPFRHTDKPIECNENSATIHVTNFSDTGVSARDVFAEYDKSMLEACWVKVVDVDVLKKLAECSYDKDTFHKNFIDNFTNKSFVDFNW